MIQKNKFKQTEIGKIPEDWKVTELGKVSDFQYGLGESARENGDIVYIRITDINPNGFLNKSGLVFIEKEKVTEKYILNKGEVLVARTGASFGKTYQFKEDFKASYGGFLIKIIFNKQMMDDSFYFHFSRSKLYWSQANNLVGGGAQPQFNANVLSKLIVPIPPLSEQKAIAKILSALDTKIEINNKINNTLEVIGQTLFNKWFVNLEGIPNGWQIKPLDEIADFLNGLALQKYSAKEGKEYLPAIKIRELRSGITDQTDKVSLDLPKDYIIEDGNILFSWSGSLEVVIWTNGKGALNQHLFKVSSKEYPKWFYYYWIRHHLQNFRKIAEGKATTMGHIQKHHLSQAEVLVPNKEKLEEFDNIMNGLINKIILLRLETRNLTNIRDSLLPKLMSGEIRTL